MPKLKFQTNLKVQAMTRHFQDGEPISSISADLRVPPAVCEQWCKEVISNLSLFFDQSLKKQEREKDRRIEELQSEVVRKQEVIGEIMEAFTTLKKKEWGKLTHAWVDLGVREEAIAFVDMWKEKTSLPAKVFCQWIGISESRLCIWRTRSGMPTAHAPFIPREDCLSLEEIEAIVSFYRGHPADGYRRCTYMMIDQNIACASPSTVYSALKRAGVLRPRRGKAGCKGKGFHQPLGPHHHWHTDITHVKVCGIPANLCSIIDGFSRYCVAHRLSKNGEALDAEAVFQQGIERFPAAKGRVISDNGKQFVCKEYRELLTMFGFTYCNTSPYYPQSNGKQERFHGSLKSESLNHKHLVDFEYAQKVIDTYVDGYNNVRLHSAVGYVTPHDMLVGRAPAIQAERYQKLKDARERRRLAFQKNKDRLITHCETEDGSAGEQPSRDSSTTTTASTVPASKTAGVPKTTACAG